MGAHLWPYAMAAWSSRMPIAVQGTVSAGPYINISSYIPTDDRLWDSNYGGMQSDGDDLRVWMNVAGGIPATSGLVDFSNDAPVTATRTIPNFLVECTLATSATTTYLFWLYWGNASAANAEGTVTNTNTTEFRIGAQPFDPNHLVYCIPEDPGATTPKQRISKKVNEEIFLWWDLFPAMPEGLSIGTKRGGGYPLSTIDWNSTTGTGLYSALGVTREATFTSQNKTRFWEDPDTGHLYVGIALEKDVGTSGTDYIAKLRGEFFVYGTGTSVQFEYMCLVEVVDPTE